ncbi:MAG: prolipoprotein diacylglyceryl transferase family protein [Candidatus Limnocylindrales bacterium]
MKTRWAPLAPLASIPGVIPGIWPLLGALAILVALVVEGLMVPHERIAGEVPPLVPLVALGSGLLAAKIWYAVLHPGPWRQALLGGWAVDGFMLAAPVVSVAILLKLGLPVAAFLDAVTPGLFLGVAIGRIGCFLAGCCAGRVTTSSWGVWSSDRKIGARRIPAQISESVAGLTIAALSTLLILTHVPRPDGVIFIGAFAVYLVIRQSLLRVRAERREFLWRRANAAVLEA